VKGKQRVGRVEISVEPTREGMDGREGRGTVRRKGPTGESDAHAGGGPRHTLDPRLCLIEPVKARRGQGPRVSGRAE
jgi:hypothetical protein